MVPNFSLVGGASMRVDRSVRDQVSRYFSTQFPAASSRICTFQAHLIDGASTPGSSKSRSGDGTNLAPRYTSRVTRVVVRGRHAITECASDEHPSAGAQADGEMSSAEATTMAP